MPRPDYPLFDQRNQQVVPGPGYPLSGQGNQFGNQQLPLQLNEHQNQQSLVDVNPIHSDQRMPILFDKWE